MTSLSDKAKALIVEFKGDSYTFGIGVLEKVGPATAELGKKALVVGPIGAEWFKPTLDKVLAALKANSVEVIATIEGANPNAPREDVFRLRDEILQRKPKVIVALESGSGTDACKAASVLATFADQNVELDDLFGAGKVTELCEKTSRQILPVVAVMTAAGSGAHLTKYANITDMVSGQKKLIIDEAVVPPRAIFDYSLTATASLSFTLDGALDGVSHCLEVYLGAKDEQVAAVENVCLTGIELIASGLKDITRDPGNLAVRELIAMGTDLGGYAIMLGGTNGPHLNSFSMVKYLPHGRACALMCPYYTKFFAPAVADRVLKIGQIYRRLGFIDASLEGLDAQQLGHAVAEGMIAFNSSIGFPTTLSEVAGLERSVLEQALTAAKNPQLQSKLQNMPVPLTAETVDKYMGSVLEAAWLGDLNKIVSPQ